MSLLKSSYDENRVKYSPVMMSRAAKAAASAVRAARNSPVVKDTSKAARTVAEGVAEEFAKREAKDTAKETWKRGRELLKKTPDRPKHPQPIRKPRFWEIQTEDSDIDVPKPKRTTLRSGGLLQSTEDK
tara:strand:- start:309 stop:695 length:387 start_codon:yes stop_codon:yes gene_type:complete